MPSNHAEKNPTLWGTRDAAAMLGIDTTTLRAWERKGVLSPSRTSTGVRLYTADDLAAARRYQARREPARASRP